MNTITYKVVSLGKGFLVDYSAMGDGCGGGGCFAFSTFAEVVEFFSEDFKETKGFPEEYNTNISFEFSSTYAHVPSEVFDTGTPKDPPPPPKAPF